MSAQNIIDSPGPPQRITHRLRKLAMLCLGTCVSFGWAISVEAQQFSVERASTELLDSVYRMDADLDYRLSAPMLDALHSGVVLTPVLEIEVYRARNYWWDETVASLEQRYEIQYHALTEQYLLRNLNSGSQASYSSLEVMLFYLGMVRQLPVIDAHLLDARENYHVRIRLGLDAGSLPVPLQLRTYVSRDWWVGSDWFSWDL